MDDNKSLIWLNILTVILWLVLLAIDLLTGAHPILKALHFILAAWWLLILEVRFQPVRRFIYWLNDQIYFNQMERLRRIKYNWFRQRVKGGDNDDFEDKARRVIK